MKLVWLSHFVPYPPRGGAHQRSYNLIRHIASKHETLLFAINLEGHSPQLISEYSKELKKHCAEVEIWDLPHRWRGARWWAELALSPLYRHPYGSRTLWSPELGRRWEAVLGRHPGALVHFDSIDLALYLPPAARFKKVLNHHNCESAMAERRAEKEPNPLKRAYLRQQARKLRRLEQEACHLFDVNLTVSELDKRSLLESSPRAHFHVVENGTDTGYFSPAEAVPEPKSVVFAASLNWYPNLSAVRFLGWEIWPRLKSQCPGIRLFLAGQKPPKWLVQWAEQDPEIVLVANPVDIRPWMARGAVFVCPILDGGGTKLKILDALAMGKAVVTTAIGCESLEVKHGENILVADTPEDFARQVLRLLGDEALRKQLGACGRALVEELYSWEVIGRHLEQAYQYALKGGPCEEKR
ncbi:MAG: glycosyltransferase family 4 protein [Acidobacteriia bacterium]|nr:glycosyltransferase family 4 protein [Terriglobia bacterium]